GGCAGSLGFSSFQQAAQGLRHRDSRIEAVDWLEQHSGRGQTVLVIREVSILSTELRRVAATATVIPWFEAADLMDGQQFDYIVSSVFDMRYAMNPNEWSAYLDR